MPLTAEQEKFLTHALGVQKKSLTRSVSRERGRFENWARLDAILEQLIGELEACGADRALIKRYKSEKGAAKGLVGEGKIKEAANSLEKLEKEVRKELNSKVSYKVEDKLKYDAELKAALENQGRVEGLRKRALELPMVPPFQFTPFNAACTALDNCVRDAKALADGQTPNYVAALKTIKPHAKHTQAVYSTSENLRAERDRQLKAQEHYDKKVERIKNVRSLLDGKPGTGDLVKKLDEALSKGEQAVKDENKLFHEGYNAVHSVVPSASKIEKQGLKAIRKATKGLAKQHPEIEAARKAAADKLAEVAPLLTFAAAGNYQKLIDMELASAHDGKVNEALAGLQNLQADMEQDRLKVAGFQSQCQKLIGEIEANFEQLRYAATEEDRRELAPFQQRFDAGKNAVASKNFEEALGELRRLGFATRGFVQRNDHTKARLKAQWEAQAKQEKDLRAKCLKIEQLEPGSSQIALRRLDEALVFGRQERYEDAMRRFATAEELVESLHRNRSARQGISQELQQAADRLKQKFQTAQQAQEKLAVDLFAVAGDTRKDEVKLLIQGFIQRRTDLEREWKRQWEVAEASEDLDPDAMAHQVDALIKEMLEAKKPGEFDKALAGVADKVFQQKCADAERVLLTLLNFDAKEYTAFLARLNATRAEAAAGSKTYDDAGAAVDALIKEINEYQQAVTAACTQKQQQVRALHTEVTRALTALRKSAHSSLPRGNRDFFDPFFSEMAEELVDLHGMSVSTSLTTLEQAVVELRLVQNRINELQTEMVKSVGSLKSMVREALATAGLPPPEDEEEDLGLDLLFGVDKEDEDENNTSTTPPPTDESPPEPKIKITFRIVFAAMNEVQNEINNDPLKVCMPTDHYRLQQEFKSLKEELATQPADKAWQALKAFRISLLQTISIAEGRLLTREQFKNELLPPVERKYKELAGFTPDKFKGKLEKLGKKPTVYADELQGRISAAKAKVVTENGEERACHDLRMIGEELDQVLRNPEVAVEKELRAIDNQAQQETLKAQYEGMHKTFGHNFQAPAEKAISNAEEPEKSQLQDLSAVLKQAEKQADMGNYFGAIEMMKNAQLMAVRIKNSPEGFAKSSRNKLPKNRDRWVQQVAKFNASVDLIVDSIGKAAAGDPDAETVAQNAQREIRRLKSLFNAQAFDKSIAIIANKKASKRERRSAREEALTHIRRYDGIIHNDVILLKVFKEPRPFGLLEVSPLKASLNELDLNVQRGV